MFSFFERRNQRKKEGILNPINRINRHFLARFRED